MPDMTLAEAAKWAGVGKPALLKAMNRPGNNRLSAHKDDKGQWHIDPAELARVYPREPEGTTAGSDDRNALEPPQDAPGNSREIALMREMLDEARKDRDRWQKEAEDARTEAREAHARADRMLTYQPQQTPPEATGSPSGQAVATMAPEGEARAMPAARHGFRARVAALIAGR